MMRAMMCAGWLVMGWARMAHTGMRGLRLTIGEVARQLPQVEKLAAIGGR
jgi:hypothetical protein